MIGILGATGFVGQNLCEYFDTTDVEFVIGGRSCGVDATNFKSLSDWINNNSIDCIINLAAMCGGIGLNMARPAELWAATTSISHNVLEASKIFGIKRLILIGTVCSYSADCPVPFKEDYLMCYGPPEPTNRAYGVAKLAALYGAQAYYKQYGMNISCLVPVNMYGKYDHFHLENSHVIPAMIKKLSNTSNSVVLWGDGTPTREFLHVTDLCRLIASIIGFNDNADFVNVGTGIEISMANLANLIADKVGFTGDIIWDDTKPNGQMRRALDVSKAKEKYGFSASVSLNDGLDEVIKWYEESKKNYKIH